jgi:energy-coupling factor transport system ATP-binding protein
MAGNNRILLETRNLGFIYGEEGEEPVLALNGIDLTVNSGEYIAIIGSNGSGKTTLLKQFNALLTPTSGEVLVTGLSTAEEANLPLIRRTCGMIFQNPDNQLVANTVEEDVAFGLENYAIEPSEIRRRVDEALEMLGLSALAGRPPHLLSGGQKQRVAIAGVLAMKPQCILMDEPTAMLDPAGQKEVLEAVHKLNRRGYTVLHVTHFPEEAALAGRVLVLDRGKLVAMGRPQEILTDQDLLHELGLRSTAIVELAALLRKEGVPLPGELLHEQELIAFLCSFRRKS